MWAMRQSGGNEQSPASGVSSPRSRANRLDLPAPLVPSRPAFWPGCRVRLALSSRRNGPRCRVREAIFIMARSISVSKGEAMTGLSDYAGWLYARPGMQALLLGLQDEAGQDVLLLLTACWLGQRKVPVEAQLWRSLQVLQAPWRQQVIEPLRQVRRT